MNSTDLMSQFAQRQTASLHAAMAGVSLVIYLFAIWISWYALGAISWEKWVKQPRSRQALVLRLLLSIIMGYSIAQFLIGYLTASATLKG